MRTLGEHDLRPLRRVVVGKLRRPFGGAGGAARVSLIALAACIDNTIVPPVAVDPEVAVSTCTGESFPPLEVAPHEECQLPQADFQLRERWRASLGPEGDASFDAVVARVLDDDHDGTASPADEPRILVAATNSQTQPARILRADGSTESVTELHEDAWRTAAGVGPAPDGAPAPEFLLATLNRAGDGSGIDGWRGAELRRVATADPDDGGFPFLAHLDDDGVADIVWGSVAVSGADGTTLASFDEEDSADLYSLAMDLDLDSRAEILTAGLSGLHILDETGQLKATCAAAQTDFQGDIETAIGNLDSDDEAEIVVSSAESLSVCEVNGSTTAWVDRPNRPQTTVAIAELDGDPLPEIIALDSEDPFTSPRCVVAAYDEQLNPLWRTLLDLPVCPFTVADLDGDGLHEIVVVGAEGLGIAILGPDGTELARLASDAGGRPGLVFVVDIDGDDLAEIVTSGWDPAIVVYTNEAGGWPVRGASDPHPGYRHFPGDRALDGSIPPIGATPHWLQPGRNVWQGNEPGPLLTPDLAVELADVCVTECATESPNGSTTAEVIAYVSNLGVAATAEPVWVELQSEAGTALAGVSVDPPIAAGTKVAVQLTAVLPPGVHRLRAVVDPAGRIAECQNSPNESPLVVARCNE